MTRPRRDAHADPGSDPAHEWGWCWVCGQYPPVQRRRTGCGPQCEPDTDSSAARAEIIDWKAPTDE